MHYVSEVLLFGINCTCLVLQRNKDGDLGGRRIEKKGSSSSRMVTAWMIFGVLAKAAKRQILDYLLTTSWDYMVQTFFLNQIRGYIFISISCEVM